MTEVEEWAQKSGWSEVPLLPSNRTYISSNLPVFSQPSPWPLDSSRRVRHLFALPDIERVGVSALWWRGAPRQYAIGRGQACSIRIPTYFETEQKE